MKFRRSKDDTCNVVRCRKKVDVILAYLDNLGLCQDHHGKMLDEMQLEAARRLL